MDCDLELKRGVDKSRWKRGTSLVHVLLLFRKCSAFKRSRDISKQTPTTLHPSIFLNSSCPFCDEDDASPAEVNVVAVGGRVFCLFFEPIPALGFEVAVLGTNTSGAFFPGFPVPPGFFLIASSSEMLSSTPLKTIGSGRSNNFPAS